MDPLEQVLAAYLACPPGEPAAPAKVWKVGEAAADTIQYGPGRDPFEGMTLVCWPE